MKHIYVGGYAGSGSSAIIDYFKENNKLETFDFEQRFIVDPDGLLQLSLLLNSNPTPYEVDRAIHRFILLVKNLTVKYSLRSYSGYQLPNRASLALRHALALLLQSNVFTYKGIWLAQNHIIHQFLHKIDRILGVGLSRCVHRKTYGIKSNVDMSTLYDSFLSCYIEELHDGTKFPDYIVFDEPYMSLSFSKLLNLSGQDNYLIAVHRDPRDQFFNAKRFKYQFVPQDVEGYVEWFKIQRKLLNDSTKTYGHRLDLKFEDLVLNYDRVSNEIDRFIGCSADTDELKFRYFDPEVSKNNIKQFSSENGYERDFSYIEDHLKDYLYF